MPEFDYNRPLIKKVLVKHPTKAEFANGQREMPIMEIGMYLDEPGTFYDAHGREVDEKVATAPGGFTKEQVAIFRVQAAKRKRMAEIEAEFQAQMDALEKGDGATKQAEGQNGTQAS